MAVKGNLLPEATFTVFLLSPACCLASLMIFFPGLPTNKVLMTSVCLRRLSPVPLQKSSALCLSTSTDFYFAKQGHPPERTLVFSAPLQSTIPKPAVPLPSFSLMLIPAQKLSSQHHSVLSFAKVKLLSF